MQRFVFVYNEEMTDGKKHNESGMLFSPKEKEQSSHKSAVDALAMWLRKIADLRSKFIDQAKDKWSDQKLKDILELLKAGRINEKETLRRIQLINSKRWDPSLDERSDLLEKEKKELCLAMRLPESIIKEVRRDFSKAFPRYAEVFESTNFDYWLGYNPLSTADLTSFYSLLIEKGTLMGEAYPFYEILTQELSEKVASSSGGLRALFLGTLSKGLGVFGYKADIPVLRHWVNLKNQLKNQYGKEKLDELIEDMYFGQIDGYEKFVTACSDVGIDFQEAADRAKEESLFINKLNEFIIRNPNVLKNPILVGGLNLPGKIHDISGPLISGLVGFGIGVSAVLSSPGWIGLAPLIGFAPVAGVGTIYHEITHIFGGNFRRSAKTSLNKTNVS